MTRDFEKKKICQEIDALKLDERLIEFDDEYTLGIDLGVGSVAVALLGKDKIHGVYVRVFSSSQDPKSLATKNTKRRECRLARRVCNRTKKRLRDIKLISKEDITNGHDIDFSKATNIWKLRSRALKEKLTANEWAAVIFNLCKKRGYLSTLNSDKETDKVSDNENKKLLSAIAENQELLRSSVYETVGEFVWHHSKFKEKKRNSDGEYIASFSREMIRNEIEILFERQNCLGNPSSTNEIKKRVLAVFDSRERIKSIENQVGNCTFESNEKRAASCSYHSELFNALSKINNLKYGNLNNGMISLTDGEKKEVLELIYSNKTVTFNSIRKKLNIANTDKFNLLTYKEKKKVKGEYVNYKTEDEKIKENEKSNVFFKAKGFHEIKDAYIQSENPSLWERDKSNYDRLDVIAKIVTYEQEYEIKVEKLREHGIEDNLAFSLSKLHFYGFNNLSVKFIKKILPFMKEGMRYDEACKKIGVDHSTPFSYGNKRGLIPLSLIYDISNPVVYRALSQSIKLLNAIINKHGNPVAINIELSRDLARSKLSKQRIKEIQQENQYFNTQSSKMFSELFSREPSRKELVKFKLYNEQNGICPYCLKRLDIERFLEIGYLENDHILPFSRTANDSYLNKSIVHAMCNQQKSNKTPLEYIDNSTGLKDKFISYINNNILIPEKKKNNYLNANLDSIEKDFISRNLNDTSYIGVKLKEIIERNIVWKGSAPDGYQRCSVVSGQLTGLLRRRWGFKKNREAGDLHHGLDALVIGAVTPNMINRIATYSKKKELNKVSDCKSQGKRKDQFPTPWDNFRHEALNFLGMDSEGNPTGTGKVRVSRMAESMSSGAAHKETIIGIKENVAYKKISIEKFKAMFSKPLSKSDASLKPLENLLGYHPSILEALSIICAIKNSDDAREKINDIKICANLNNSERRNFKLILATYLHVLKMMRIDKINEKRKERNKIRKEKNKKIQEYNKINNLDKQKEIALYSPLEYPELRFPNKNGVHYLKSHIVKSLFYKNKTKFHSLIHINRGYVEPDTITRIDIYEKDEQLFAVPVYLYQLHKGNTPKLACNNSATKQDWIEMTEEYKFKFSIKKNDWIEITDNEGVVSGYFNKFSGTDSKGRIFFTDHDSPCQKGKKIKLLHSKTIRNIKIKKFKVDILGRLYKQKK